MPQCLPMPEAAPSPILTPRRSRHLRALVCSAFGVLLVAAAGTPLAASTQLSDGHAFSDVDFDKTSPKISPNGQWAVYGQDAVVDGAFELWSVPLAGGNPVRLSDVLTATQHVTFAISPNSARVVYMVDQDTLGKTELFSVPIGGGVSTKLNANLGNGRNVLNFQISPTSDRVFYVADQGTNQNVFDLYSVSITGGGSVRLSVDKGSQWDVDSYRISSDGETVVYRPVATAFGNGELWSVPADGPMELNVILNRALTSGGAVEADFQISADNTRVVYRADASTDETFELYSVPIIGGTSTKLNGSLAGDVTSFQISPNNARVVYRADQATAGTFQLYSVPIAGGTATVLNGSLAAGRDVEQGFSISGDSSKVVYRSDETIGDLVELYSVPLAGGTPTKLNGALNAAGDVLGTGAPTSGPDPTITPDSTRVVYVADAVSDGLNEIYSVPIGGGTAVKLNRALTAGGDVQNYRLTPDSNWVIYGADGETDGTDELYAAPIAGGTVLDVSGPLVFGGDVILKYVTLPIVWEVSSNSRDVLYAADEDFDEEIELYTASLGGPPSAPTSVVATPGNTQVTVTFAAPSNNGGSPILGYTVTPSPATAGWIDSNAGSTSLTHVITNLTNGTAYTFTVRATNANGISDPSAPSNSATPATVPSAPSAAGAVPRNNGADVTFAASASNGGSAISGYTVISNPPGGVDLTQGSTALKHYVVGLTNGIPYTFTVVAQNGVGTSPASAPTPAVTPGCAPKVGANLFCDGVESNDTSAWSFTAGPPGAPTGVVAAAGNAQATVTFVPPVDNGGAAISGYTVTSIPAGGVDSNAGAIGLSHVVTGLTNGTSYTFTVVATNANGSGPASLPSNAVTPATVPAAPTGVVAVAGDTTATVVFVAPLDDGGSPILGYTVTSSPAGGTDTNAGQPGLSHAITGLTNGVEYTFTVTATNAAGTGADSKPSNPVTPGPS